jgi:hypothetical protein
MVNDKRIKKNLIYSSNLSSKENNNNKRAEQQTPIEHQTLTLTT